MCSDVELILLATDCPSVFSELLHDLRCVRVSEARRQMTF
jgi:hypothetical protein